MNAKIAVEKIWPQGRQLIIAVLERDDKAIRRQLDPHGSVLQLYKLYGLTALEILLKTLLGRMQVGLAQAIAGADKYVYVEYVWLDGLADVETEYDHNDIVTLRMRQYRKQWRVSDINPSDATRWITSATARGLVAEQRLENDGEIPQSVEILPLTLLAGMLTLPLQSAELRDPVEKLLLPMMQTHGFGAQGLVGALRLWRDFCKRGKPDLSRPAVWAASAELIMTEQAMIETTQAAVAKAYNVSMTKLFAPTKMIKQRLKIDDVDERYSPLTAHNLILKS